MNTVRISNSRSTPLRLLLEPWAEELQLATRCTITIEQEDDGKDGRLEIEIMDDAAVLWGNVNCKLRIKRGSEVIWESYGPP